MGWRLVRHAWNTRDRTLTNIKIKWMKHEELNIKNMKNIEKQEQIQNYRDKLPFVMYVIHQWRPMLFNTFKNGEA